MLTGEVSKRDCEIYAIQSRMEMTEKQQQDQTHHINVLKEQVKTREHKIAMLTTDVSHAADTRVYPQKSRHILCYVDSEVPFGVFSSSPVS